MRLVTARRLLGISALTLYAAGAQAFSIDSIFLEVRQSGYAVQGGDSISDLVNEFRSSAPLICAKQLQDFDAVGSKQSCNGPIENVATLISMNVTGENLTVNFEFGPDWGRGGVVFIENASSAGPLLDDLWWRRDWANPDVLRFDVDFAGMQEYTVNFLGFEGCCAGEMSLRYTTDPGDDEAWQNAGVSNVPAPPGLALLGIGLLGLGLQSSKRMRA